MPPSNEDVTDVEDYLFKLLEYKFSSEELSTEDVELSETTKLKQEIENDAQLMDELSAADQSLSVNNQRTALAFKKKANKGFLVLKKSKDKVNYKVVFVRHG